MTDLDFSSLKTNFYYKDLVPQALREPAGVNLLEGAVSHLGLVYRALTGWRPLRLDLHLPSEGVEPFPVVVYVHGGSFVGGVPEMGPWSDLPRRGIAVAAVTYRLAAEAVFPAAVEDILGAVSWLVDHAGRWELDAERITLWGSSAGGFLAGIAAVEADASRALPVRAVVCHYPLTDCGHLVEDALPGGKASAQRLENILRRYFATESPSLAIANFLESAERTPPFLIVHGTADLTVGPRQSERLHQALIAVGATSRLRMADQADHGSHQFYSTAAIEEAVEFFEEVWSQ